jgi:hypothetical protein
MTYLQIYGVVGCDLDYTTEGGDICVFRIDFKTYETEAEEIKDGVFKVTTLWGDEHTGTIEELLELHTEGQEIFEVNNLEDEYAYDGGIHQEPPIDEDYETDWDSEEFFINKEEALKYYKDELNSAAAQNINGIPSYSSKPKN